MCGSGVQQSQIVEEIKKNASESSAFFDLEWRPMTWRCLALLHRAVKLEGHNMLARGKEKFSKTHENNNSPGRSPLHDWNTQTKYYRDDS